MCVYLHVCMYIYLLKSNNALYIENKFSKIIHENWL